MPQIVPPTVSTDWRKELYIVLDEAPDTITPTTAQMIVDFIQRLLERNMS